MECSGLRSLATSSLPRPGLIWIYICRAPIRHRHPSGETGYDYVDPSQAPGKPGLCHSQPDFKNAFCAIKRDHCLTVLRKLCPHRPQWLDVAENLLSRATVVSYPAIHKPNRTWDRLPQGDPMSALIFSTVMTETVNTAVKQLTSEEQALSYVDDTVLSNALAQLPALLRASGLELQPPKTQVWAPRMQNLMRVPALRKLRSQMKDPRGLILLGEALDPFPVGEEAFIQEHLRGVTEAIPADLRKIATLPDKLQDGQAGLHACRLGPPLQNPPTQGGSFASSPPGVRHQGTMRNAARPAPGHCQTVHRPASNFC